MTRRFGGSVYHSPLIVARNISFAISRDISTNQHNLIFQKCLIHLWANNKVPSMYLMSKVSLKVFSNRHGLVITNQSKKILALNSGVAMTVYVSQILCKITLSLPCLDPLLWIKEAGVYWGVLEPDRLGFDSYFGRQAVWPVARPFGYCKMDIITTILQDRCKNYME